MSAVDRRDVTATELGGQVQGLLDDGLRLALVAAHEDSDAFRVVYLLTGSGNRRVELALRTSLDAPTVPSLARLSFPAGRFERVMRDLYGIVPIDHPLPRRMVRHKHWPTGWYPMRSDAGSPPPFGPTEGAYPFLRVEGPGVYEIPVGPVHAGMIGPGHFRFSVVGESILKLKARLWFTHKGLTKLAEGRTPAEALPLAERISGDTTVGHTTAFCSAVEDALGVDVPEPARAARAALLELERLYNHVADLGALCMDVGYGILNVHAQRVREDVLRLGAEVTGHRLMRGGVVLGGAALAAVPTAAQLTRIADDVTEIVDHALRQSVVVDRFTGTGLLTAANAREIGVLGYVGRASGLDVDARRDHPSHPATVSVPPALRTEGDVLARFSVRADEVRASVDLLRVLLPELRSGRWVAEVPAHPAGAAGAAGSGLVEGWRGTIAHRIEIGPDGCLTRLAVVDPSFLTWPALPVALRGMIVADFPVINKSFNLSYAGNDL
ncbi:hydrogenase large subunit [Demequina lutea]|uniref:Ni,Fe-hydrogenase III large subunit/Ni,Fe-hydrogenase III component G n=1 Tax=Demequina lutea TaxID=431489 RepID=A0A7Y9ZC48_9MICO|nr:NADH-quinone oxidoreductase subunit C [Demequina lutea]NYI41483.1 Ni,Fe-hydrogenase III large subunit/Ni,Fe-hydrogenase III component G [Demequina lutea]